MRKLSRNIPRNALFSYSGTVQTVAIVNVIGGAVGVDPAMCALADALDVSLLDDVICS